ncbi:MAG: alanine racemase [Candidatus Cloacimonadaceae bacterium]|jgi:alanine racemase|nr:alanine racemase [Candidatus Cloacimonadota bacterium]MDY0127783.1 alanine racemase [Candidatus Cloacimonadaceae bacterium]MCB5254203.1 alanine racemase [Candidatus Cloacimonadota bacterium]MCK9178767.1 alanine racemase [Candidatus Cloacimonadota bacterium]MCK9243522.1 alanine racemase [Candidatus Cloacimonadota bacterium]
MLHSSWIELDSSAVNKNIRYLKKRIGPDVTYVSVIKGNAYGHGIEQYLPLAEAAGVHNFAVYDAYEAYRALQVKAEDTQLIIMGMLDADQMDWVIEHDIAFFVFNKERLEAATIEARKQKKKALIHLELETGMNRTGLDEDELPDIIKTIKGNRRYLSLQGVCTHYAGAESIANYFRIHKQFEQFNNLCKILKKSGIVPLNYHSACSAAALIYPHTMMDMVRFGIAQYGFWPSMETKMNNLLSEKVKFTRDPLKAVLRWKSRVMSVKPVDRGKFVNYGNAYLSPKDMKLATVPIGYYQGYSRSLGNSGQVLIRGKKADVVGTVNMNMFMVNVSHIKDVAAGDEVVIIGKQGDLKITVSSFSELTKMVNYELLSRLPYQIPRIII